MAGEQRKFIHAAGGLLWRESASGREILVIHRQRYDDWTIPKGKLDSDEHWQEAALREVQEETNYEATIDSFAGAITYYHGKRPKVVLYWNMTPSHENDPLAADFDAEPEVDDKQWMVVDEALERLSYPGEQTMVDQNRDADDTLMRKG